MARTAVIVVTYNSAQFIDRCLRALLAQTAADFEVIVWDNASCDDTAARIAAFANQLTFVQSDMNLGFAAGNNRAAALSEAPLIALLNPDAFPEPDWLEQSIAAMDVASDVAMVGSVQRDALNPEILDGVGDVYHAFGQAYRGGYGKPAPDHVPSGVIFGPCAAAALYRRDAFEQVGGFDERFFCYHEDVDLAFRMRLAGWRAVLAASSVVHHVGSASTAKRSPFAVYHGSRNRLWTFVKCMPAPLLAALWPFHALLTLALLSRDALRDWSAFRAGVRGVWDGLKGMGPMWRDRRQLHRQRPTSLARIAAAMTWSPVKLFRRAPDIRTLDPKQVRDVN